MATQDSKQVQQGAGYTWMLEHLLTYPGTYEIPLRTMYTLNSNSSSQPSSPTSVVGNAFPRKADSPITATATAAAQLKANLISHISAQPSQPQSLPPAFITSFVRKCFAPTLEEVDFPQALTALDYLKDLEARRRSELRAALTTLGVCEDDLRNIEQLAKKHPNAYNWVKQMNEKGRKLELLYTHIYCGLRRWTLVNEMSLPYFDKTGCLVMLNTLYPPVLDNEAFKGPTKHLTAQVLNAQRQQFFRYINSVEKKGKDCLVNVVKQNAREGEETGWPRAREDLNNYLVQANMIIDECLEVTGRSISPTSPTFSHHADEEQKRKVDSGISFGSNSGYISNRSSGQSHVTRPSTSTSSSVSTHSRHASKDKSLHSTTEDDETVTLNRPAGSALERIARELRKIGSRSALRDTSQSRPAITINTEDNRATEVESPPPTPSRGLRLKRSFKNIRSASRNRSSSTSRPASRNGSASHMEDVPDFDREAMSKQRAAWEQAHAK